LTTLPRAREVSIDRTVALFAVGLSLASGVIFGLAPAASAANPADALTGAGRTSAAGRLRPVLVAAEVALAVVLLAGAGLLMRSFDRLLQVDSGFEGDRIITARLFLPRATHPPAAAVRHYSEMIGRVSALPDVESVAAVSHFPFSGLAAGAAFEIVGRPAEPGRGPVAEFRAATVGYFRTMGIGIVGGRDFADTDGADAPFVSIINRAAADRYFPGQNALDQSVRILGPTPRRIVGIVQNIRHRSLDSPISPEIYVPHPQFPAGGMFLAVRARSADPGQLTGSLRATLRAFDPSLPIASLKTWQDLLGETLSRRRFSLVLLTLFAASALALSVIGIYGVLAFTVAHRAREIGIRMALGATTRHVLRHVVGRSLVPVGIGLLIGLVTALAASRALVDMLYEIRPTDPITLIAVAMLLLAAALAAALIPARRAARVDPMIALRYE
jgi:putative ABC transport system permease protein